MSDKSAKNLVSLVKAPAKGRDYLRAGVSQALELIDDPLSGIGRGSVVLIKPNITANSIFGSLDG